VESSNQSSRSEPVDDGQPHLTPQLVDTSLVVGRIVQVNYKCVFELITKQEKLITLKVRVLYVVLGGLVTVARNMWNEAISDMWSSSLEVGASTLQNVTEVWTWMDSSEWPRVHSHTGEVGIKMDLVCEHLNWSGQGLVSGEPIRR
jgi:hypothetical protein